MQVARVCIAVLFLISAYCEQQCYDDCKDFDPNRNDYRRQSYQWSNCFCDKVCAIYGDCCYDANKTNGDNVGGKLQFSCGQLVKVQTMSGARMSVYYVQKCSDIGARNESTRRKCEQVSRLGGVSQLLPVSAKIEANGAKIVFRNRYCALCNGFDLFESWNIGIACHSMEADKLNATLIFSKILSGKVSSIDKSCSLTYSPKAQDEFDALPFCKRAESVTECVKSSNASLEKCTSGPVSYRYAKHTVEIFRNEECIKCAGISHRSSLKCHPTWQELTPYDGRYLSPISLTVIFDMVDDSPVQMIAFHGNPDTRESRVLSEQARMQPEAISEKCLRANASSMSEIKQSDCFTSAEFPPVYNTTDLRNSAKTGWEEILSLVCISVSILALLLQIIVIVWSGSYRRSFGSKLMLLLSTSLILHYSFFFGFLPFGRKLCVIRAVLLDVTTKCVFLWMQVLIFDILLAMWPGKSSGSELDSVKRADQRKRLLKYCAYVYGAPWMFTVPGLVIDKVDPSCSFAPLYGVRVCYYNSKYGKLVFQYIPMCLVFLVNLILCALTIKYIQDGMKKGTKLLNTISRRDGTMKRERDEKEQREQALLYLRLILLSGVTWTFALVNAFWGNLVLRVATIVCDGLLGLLVAVSYMCSRAIRRRLRARLCNSESSATNSSQLHSALSVNSRGHSGKSPLL